MRRKNNYVMGRLNTPKKVTLPNGRTSYAKEYLGLRFYLML